MSIMRPLATLCAAVVLVSGCRGSEEEDPQDHVEFLGSIDGVAEVTSVPWADDKESEYLRITLEDDLPDEDVREAVEEIKDHYDQEDVEDPGSLQVVFDEFSAGVYPRHTGLDNPDPDFERALWLRADGRATSYGPGPHFHPGEYLSQSGTRPLVIAPAHDVAQLALDYDAAVPHDEEVRRSHLVGSADGAMRVIWENSDGLDLSLDRDALEVFAALQEQYPGTTGWYEDPQHRAAVHFDPADIGWDELRTRGPELIEGLPVVEIAWGPLRAPSMAALVRQLRQPALRARVAALSEIAGVRDFDRQTVSVEDRASYDAVRRLLRAEGDRSPQIALVRGTSPYIDFTIEPVFEGDAFPSADLQRIHDAALDVAAVTYVRIGYGGGFLAVRESISDSELRRVLRAFSRSDEALPLPVVLVPPGEHGYAGYEAGVVRRTRVDPPEFIDDSEAAAFSPEEIDAFHHRLVSAWRQR